jgi:hypothetical protein
MYPVFIEEEMKLFNQLTEKSKQLIAQFNPDIDTGRNIPQQELLFRAIYGKNAICGASTFYKLIKELNEYNIISAFEGKSTYTITSFGWRIWKFIYTKKFNPIPKRVEEQRDLLIYRISRTKPFSENPSALKIWSETFSILIQNFNPIFLEVGENAQVEFVNAIGLTVWNQFYQPILITNENFIIALQLNSLLTQSRIFIVCDFFDLEYFILENNLWFVCQYLNFWKQRYKDLFRYYMSKIRPEIFLKESLKKSEGIKDQTIKILEGAPPSRKINNKVIFRLAKEILYQKGHNWPEIYCKDRKWIYRRLEALLLKSKRDKI